MKYNYDVLFYGNWSTMDEFWNHLEEQRKSDPSPDHYMIERKAAVYIQKTFSGFGPKQSRNFWQSLGLTRYEFVLDSPAFLSGFVRLVSPPPFFDGFRGRGVLLFCIRYPSGLVYSNRCSALCFGCRNLF